MAVSLCQSSYDMWQSHCVTVVNTCCSVIFLQYLVHVAVSLIWSLYSMSALIPSACLESEEVRYIQTPCEIATNLSISLLKLLPICRLSIARLLTLIKLCCIYSSTTSTRRWHNVGLMLGHRLRRDADATSNEHWAITSSKYHIVLNIVSHTLKKLVSNY